MLTFSEQNIQVGTEIDSGTKLLRIRELSMSVKQNFHYGSYLFYYSGRSETLICSENVNDLLSNIRNNVFVGQFSIHQ